MALRESSAVVDSLENFVAHFSECYEHDPGTREIIHDHANLSPGEVLKLNLARFLWSPWHRRMRDAIIVDYARHIHAQMRDLEELEKLEAELVRRQEELAESAEKANRARAEISETANKHQDTAAELEAQAKAVEGQSAAAIAARDASLQQEIATTIATTDPIQASRRLIENQLLQSDLLKRDDDGQLTYDETAIVNRLEELFLTEFVKGIEDRQGRGSWLDRQIHSLAGSRSPRLGRIRSASEIRYVDWIASTKYAQSRGLPMPCYPFLLTRQPNEDDEKQSGAVNAAICIDTSPSMNDNNRFVVAKKLALALNALMRRINPGRQVHLGHFNFQAHCCTAGELYREVVLRNNTNTHLGLSWLYEVLASQRPAVAYLITDGCPSSRYRQLMRAADRFAEHDDLHLRLVLVDGDNRAKNVIRGIGQAAGPGTRVILVNAGELANEVIIDVVNTIEGIYDIAEI